MLRIMVNLDGVGGACPPKRRRREGGLRLRDRMVSINANPTTVQLGKCYLSLRNSVRSEGGIDLCARRIPRIYLYNGMNMEKSQSGPSRKVGLMSENFANAGEICRNRRFKPVFFCTSRDRL